MDDAAFQEMFNRSSGLFAIALWVVTSLWIVFAFQTWAYKQTTKSVSRDRLDPKATTGLVLQLIGFVCVLIPRPLYHPIVFAGYVLTIIPAGFAMVFAIWSNMMIYTVYREYRRDWAIKVEIIPGRVVMMSGPFRTSRHPLYAAYFMMLIATGFVWTFWYTCLAGILLYWIGTSIRIKAEEQPLIDSFDRRYADYLAKSAPMFPRWTSFGVAGRRLF